MRPYRLLVPLAALALVTACAPQEEASSSTTENAASGSPSADPCAKDSLQTHTPGRLTLATDQPAYEPWVVDNKPGNGKGFESAVAYAVAQQLGFGKGEVGWVRVPFDAAVQPGPKTFDFDINQFSITPQRKKAVDFSAPYFDVSQAVVAIKGNKAAKATSLADLKSVTFGAQIGTTSLQAIQDAVAPTTQPRVFNTNDDAKLALANGQIDALVVDLPTAFYLTSAELDNGVIVGQLPPTTGEQEQFGLLLDKGSPLTECVSKAVDALRADGTLDQLQQKWLADVAGAPVLS